MTRIAHLSDLHLLEEAVSVRKGQARLRVNYLSLRRPLDVEDRRDRAVRAFRLAIAAGFDHLVVTGDLTEDGQVAQYDMLAEVLEESGVEPERVTLLPGNHDAYGGAWEEALEGPLGRWARGARPGAVTKLRGATLIAGCTAVPQSFLKSSGRIDDDQLAIVDEVARKSAGDAIVLAQHHPPFKVMHHWVHGLVNHADVWALLREHPRLTVLHGHIHRRKERGLAKGERVRIFSPTAVTDSEQPLRLYDVVDGELVAVPLPEADALPVDLGLGEMLRVLPEEADEGARVA